MEERLTCSMNFQNKPIWFCNCFDENMFICLEHAGQHVESASYKRHLYTRIEKNPEVQTKTIISRFLKDLKLQTKQDRLKIVKEASQLIMQIKEATSKSLEKLLDIEKKLDEYINLYETLDEVV